MGIGCVEHQFPKSYICTTPDCSKPSFICAICIKEKHHDCQSKLFVQVEKLKEKVKFEEFDKESAELSSELNKYLDEQIETLCISLLDRKEALLSELQKIEPCEDWNEFWRVIKKDSEILVENDGSTISIKPKLPGTKVRQEKKVRAFKDEVEQQISTFLKDFSEIRFCRIENMESEDWLGSPFIIASSSKNGLTFTSGPDFPESRYNIKYWKIPKFCVNILVTIEGIRPDCRCLTFGLFLKKDLAQVSAKNQFIYDKSFCAYFGYGAHKMQGNLFATSSTDKNGFDKGRQFIIEVVPRQPLKIYSKDKKLDLVGDEIISFGEQYYLFVDLYYKQNSCTLKLLN